MIERAVPEIAVLPIVPKSPAVPDWYAGSAGHQWRLVAVLLIVTSLGTIDRQIITLLINPIRASLGISDFQMSLVVGGAFALSTALFSLPAGYLADRISRRGLIAWAALVWSLCTMACASAGTFGRLFVLRTAVGFGESVTFPSSASMLRSGLAPQRLGRGYAIQSMGLIGGAALALIFGGLVIGIVEKAGINHLPLFGAVQPWQITLLLAGALGLPLPLLLLTVKEPTRERAPATSVLGGFSQAFRLFRSRADVYVPLLIFQLSTGLVSLSWGAWNAAMIGRTFNLSYAQIGAWVGLMLLVVPPFGLWTVGHLMDRAAARRGVRGPVLIGLGATALILVTATAAPLAPTLPLFWVDYACLCLVIVTVYPLNSVVTASITPPQNLGGMVGLQLFITGIMAAGLGPTLTAVVSDWLFTGSRAIGYGLSLVSGFYTLIAFGALVRVYVVLGRSEREGVECEESQVRALRPPGQQRNLPIR